ncbi:hypothetical protein G9A89_005925 [Geosiphon pyriformis]|nr:hypothetical protein G9A89_005925 [Geosiphon pyriformis]
MSDDNTELVLPGAKFVGSNWLPSVILCVLKRHAFEPVKLFTLNVKLSNVPGKTNNNNLNKAKKLAVNGKILVNNNLRKANIHLNQKIIVKKIPVDLPKLAVESVFSKFGKIISIKIQLIGLGQKALVEFDSSEIASLVVSMWSVLMGKDSVHVALTIEDKQTWKKLVLVAHLVSFDGKTWTQIAGGSFSHVVSLGLHGANISSGAKVLSVDSFSCDVSGLNDHLAVLECSLELLANQVSDILKRLSDVELVSLAASSHVFLLEVSAFDVPISGLDMAVNTLLFSFDSSHLVSNGTVAELGPSSSKILTSKVSGLESKLSALEASVGSVLTKLDLLCSGSGSVLVWKFVTYNIWSINVPVKQADVVCWHVSSGNIMFFITETKLRSSIGPWIKSEYDSVCIFIFGLEVGFLGTGVAVIMNNSLAHHVSKVKKVPGWIVVMRLLFKNKLSVSVVGLYAGVSLGVRFGQAFEVNSLIAKAANSSTFVILGGDFNENRSGRNASFKFCSSLGLVNSFAGYPLVGAPTWGNSRRVEKTIDFIFVSKNLASAVTGHGVSSVLGFFNTDHSAVMVSVGLSGLLDVYLNSLYKYANKDHWKFNIKDADEAKWSRFRDCFFAVVLDVMDSFCATAADYDLDIMWSLLKKVLVDSADVTFFQHWFSEFYCSKNKQSSKFLGLKLLIVKIIKKFGSADTSDFDHLVRKWSMLDADKALVLVNMADILKFLSVVRREYRKFKMYESKLVQETAIREAIEKHIEKFCSNKGSIIRSVLGQPFWKIMLDHLVVNDELVLEPEEVKLKIDRIMEGWMRKWMLSSVLPDLWVCQYASLVHVRDDAFSGVINAVSLSELLLVIGGLPDEDDGVPLGVVKYVFKRAWVSMISKPYDWDGFLTNTHPIALIKMAKKILSKIFSNRILFVCSKFNILRDDNFSVLKSTSTQSPVFAVGLVVENVLKKNRELWLVLQDMYKALLLIEI